jgi:hypothetical protein
LAFQSSNAALFILFGEVLCQGERLPQELLIQTDIMQFGATTESFAKIKVSQLGS